MQKDKHKTKVIFRKYKEGDIIALFPDEIDIFNYECMSYMRIGQHGEVNYSEVVTNTKLAKSSEYKSLKKELESLGYNLEVRKRK